jgi:hypothetical protein
VTCWVKPRSHIVLIWRMCGFTSKKSLFPPGGPHCSFSPPNILLCSASTPPGASRRAVVAWLYERGARKQFYGFSVNFTGAVGAGAGAPTPRQERNLRIFFRAPLSLQCHRRPFDLPCAVWAPHRAYQWYLLRSNSWGRW